MPAGYANLHGVSALTVADFMTSWNALWSQHKPGPAHHRSYPKAIPFCTPKQQVYKLQEIGAGCVCGGVSLRNRRLRSYTRHQELCLEHYKKAKYTENTNISPVNLLIKYTLTGSIMFAKTSQISLLPWAKMSTSGEPERQNYILLKP